MLASEWAPESCETHRKAMLSAGYLQHLGLEAQGEKKGCSTVVVPHGLQSAALTPGYTAVYRRACLVRSGPRTEPWEAVILGQRPTKNRY